MKWTEECPIVFDWSTRGDSGEHYSVWSDYIDKDHMTWSAAVYSKEHFGWYKMLGRNHKSVESAKDSCEKYEDTTLKLKLTRDKKDRL